MSAPVTVVGRLHAPRALDRHGRFAQLDVETVLRGAPAPGAKLRIAWEQLSETSPPQFRDGQRILVVLEPPPDWSLWRERLGGRSFLVIALRGRAWIADPTPESVDALERFLALGPADEASEPGARVLAALVARAQPELSLAALDRLATHEALTDPSASERLSAALLDRARPLDVRRAILGLPAAGLRPLRPAIDRLSHEPALELEALDAAARLDGALAPAQVHELLSRSDARARVLAVRHAGPALDLAELEGLAADDPAPAVRTAALGALAARPGPEVLEPLGQALFDPAGTVRAEAASRLGERGAEAVPLLLRLALERSSPEAGGPVVALGLAGPAGREALERILATHEDHKVRSLAALALGRPLPEP